MDSSTKKSFEIQAQVRQNAEVFKNTLNDLYSWEKDIKDKEQKMQNPAAKNVETEHLKTLPVRSHVEQQLPKQQQQQPLKLNKLSADADADGAAAAIAHVASLTNGMGRRHQQQAPPAAVKSPVEKPDKPLVVNEEKRKRANEIKDRGNKHVKLGEYEKASQEYSAAIFIFPEDAVYYSNRALCYLKLERFNDCIEDCERAIQIDSSSVKAYYRRMQANESLGNDMDALKDCTSVLMMEPKNQEAQKSLERINERLHKNIKSKNGPNFSALTSKMYDILPIETPVYRRKIVSLTRVPVADVVVVPKDSKNSENSGLQISDEDIDKLFNSNCGPFVEVKKNTETGVKLSTSTPPTPTVQSDVNKIKLSTSTPPTPTVKSDVNTIKLSTSTPPTPTVKSDVNKMKKEELPNPATDKPEKVIKTATKVTHPNDGINRMMASLQAELYSLPPPPTTTGQFYSTWRGLSPLTKYRYLKSIELSNLCKLLGAGFDSYTLTDILQTLHDYYLADKYSLGKCAATLFEISKNKQVAILSMLMSSDERKVLTHILNTIKEDPSNVSIAGSIAKNFNLN